MFTIVTAANRKMPLDASYVGTAAPDQIIDVSPRRALAFAAGIEYPAPSAYDDADEETFKCLPFFCVALEWSLSLATAKGAFGMTRQETMRALHAGQDTTFHQAIRPGARVKVGGRLVSAKATSAGVLATTRMEIRDAETDAVYSTTYTDALFAGVPLDGENTSIDDRPPRQARPPLTAEGPNVASTRISVDQGFTHRYSECAQIWNPIHTEQKMARSFGLPGIIVHGTALWSIAGRELLDAYGNLQPGRLKRLSGRFAKPVRPGTDIIIRHQRDTSRPEEISFSVINDDQEEAVSEGFAVINPL